MKQYIGVTAKFDSDGNLLPLAVHWQDGRSFEIDRVLDVRFASSLKAGGAGLRYKCRIQNKERYIFFEENRWFVDTRD